LLLNCQHWHLPITAGKRPKHPLGWHLPRLTTLVAMLPKDWCLNRDMFGLWLTRFDEYVRCWDYQVVYS
jgi:hypothetical protein